LLKQWKNSSKKGKHNPGIKCPYCGRAARLVTGYEIYIKSHDPDLCTRWFWICTRCKAYVGCVGYSTEPLGELADAETRRERIHVHKVFDPLWKHHNSRMTRAEAYKWLANKLGMTEEECHIGRFDAFTCRRVIGIIKEDH